VGKNKLFFSNILYQLVAMNDLLQLSTARNQYFCILERLHEEAPFSDFKHFDKIKYSWLF